MAWIFLILAGCFEIVGLYFIKNFVTTKKKGFLIMQIASFACSFILLTFALNSIPMGTAYAIWTGIGTAGGTIMGILVFKEPKNFARIAFISCILIGAIGLKLIEG